MSVLYLTADQVRLAQIAIIVAILGFFVIVAIVSALHSEDRPQPSPLRFADLAPRECGRCGGAGVVDMLDDWDRPIAYDVACPSCGGSGEVSV